ncbi:MAG: ABC transporter permease, partial [Acidimicrobiales bacterium]|nr:ABC transporter permease [Acidimicrobiales bacterium]
MGMLIAILIAVSMLTFGAMNLLGDPLFNILGPIAGDTENPENIAKIQSAKEQFYLDRSLPERYGRWLGDFVTGDFGVRFSATGQPPVSEVIKERLPRTLALSGMAMTFTLAIGIPWGVWSGSRSDTIRDRMSTGVAF